MDEIWEIHHSSRHWGRYPSDHLVSTILRRFPLRSSRELLFALDMGCGAGANISFLLDEGFNVTGVDGSASAIRNANIRFSSHDRRDRLNLICSQFSNLNFASLSFDLVVDYLAFYAARTSDILSYYELARSFLNSDGILYSRVWGTETYGSQSGDMIEPFTSLNPSVGPCKDMGISHFFTSEELHLIFSDWSTYELSRILTTLPSGNHIEEFVIIAQP